MSISKDEVLKNLDQVKDFIQEIEQEKKETKKVSIQIKNRWTGDVIYESEKTTFKEAVKEAIKSKVDLSETNLSGSDLSKVNLSGSDLSKVNLSGSDLSGSDLSEVNLYGSDLYGANLSGSDLSGAKFWGKIENPIILKEKQVNPLLNALGFKRE